MTPLLATKLFIPAPRPDAVQRPRLVERLERGRTRPLTLVSAPAGFGKTTLVSSWVGEYGVRAGWVSLDEGDNDPVRFWLYWIAAVQRLFPELGQEAYSLLQSTQALQLEMVVTLLLNEIASLDEMFVMILDDYHVIENQEIHHGVGYMLDHLPAQMRLVLATRGDPPFPLARMRARGQLNEIRMADLAFTPDETSTLFNEIMGLDICAEDIAALDTRTEGWAAGLQLAALSIQGKENVQNFIEAFKGSHAYIVDYLVEDVLDEQPEEIQSFLLQTSILERLSGPLCAAVTGRADSAAILETLRQANLFVVALDMERRWYRYHHLFAEVLRHRLQTVPPPVGVRELHARASQWYEQEKLIEEAILHAFSAQDLSRVIILIETFAEDWTKRGENQTVYAWLQRIPEEVIHQHPRLSVVYALVLLWMHRLDEANHFLDEAEKITPAGSKLKGQIFATRALTALRQSQYEYTIDLTQQASALISPADLGLKGRLMLAYGIAWFWKDDHARAMGAFEEATQSAQQAEDWHTALYAMADHALMFSLRGQLREAEKLFRHSLAFAATHHMEHSLSANLSYGHLIDLGHEWNDFEMVDRYLEKAIRQPVIAQDPARKLSIVFKLIKKSIALKDFSEANRYLQEAYELVKSYQLANNVEYDVAYYQVCAWLAQGNLSAATAWLEITNISPEDEIPSTLQEPLYLALARILIAQGRPAEAIHVLKRLMTLAQTVGRIWIQFEMRGLLIIALAGNGEREAAMSLLRQTLLLAEPEGYIRSLVEAGDDLCPLIQTVRREFTDHPNLTAYLDRLIQAFDRSGEPRPLPSPPTNPHPEPLSDREREILAFIDAGLSNREIADRLYISVSTVKTHINNLYGKLDANSRTQALAIARKLGVLMP